MANRTTRTPKRDEKFFAALAAGDTVTKACRKAGYGRTSVFEWRRDDAEFAARYQDADEQAVERMEAEADRRAVQGIDKPVFYQGQPVGQWYDAEGLPCLADAMDVNGIARAVRFVRYDVREYSDTLLMFRLKAKRPDRYRENSKVEHSGGIKVVRLPAKETSDA